jgi:branched-chain amino acid transport system permease protein
MGVVVGAIAIRRQGIYFAMITLGLAQLNYFVCLQAPFTGGENALQAVPRGRALGVFDMNNMTVLYAAVLVIFWAGFFVIHRTIHSPMGEVLKAIRDHEPRALSLGYEADHYKLIAFSLSAALAALAGSTKAIVFQLASLTDVHWTTSGEVILMTLIGGLGRVSGPLIGAFIMVTLEQYLAPLGAWGPVVQGGIFVSCVMTFREGIMGVASKLLRRPGRTHHPRAELTSDVGDQ